MESNLQIDLKDTIFTNPGLYFLKLELSNLSSNETETLGLRTEVFGEETTSPNFKQSSFKVHYDTYKNAKLKISALQIDRNAEGKPKVIPAGSVEIALDKIIETVEKESLHSIKSRFTKGGKYVGEITTRFEFLRPYRESSAKSSSSSSGNIGRILFNRSMIHSEKDISDEESEESEQPIIEKVKSLPGM
jgi:hypothetical protein